MKHIYIFSGLGADERAFGEMDFSAHNVTFIDWIPAARKETIESYANRLVGQIREENPVLIGLSFGGMVAIELAKIIPVEKVILLASAKTRHELPAYYRMPPTRKLHRIMPVKLMKKSNWITNWFFGTESKADKKLLKAILDDTDPRFFRWALNEIAHWKNETLLPETVHIHGTKDRIIPFRNVKCDHEINGGGHFMTVNKAAELSELVKRVI